MPAVRLIAPLFVILWATGFIGARYAMPWAEPFSFLALRFAISFSILGALVALLGRRRLGARDAVHAMVAGALMHGVYLGGVFWAIRHGMPAGLSALIVGLQPLITALLAGLILGERVTVRHWAGLMLGFAGVALVLGPGLAGAGGTLPPAGIVACLVAVVGMAAGTVWQKRFVSASDMVTGTMWQYLGGVVPVAILAAVLESGDYVLTGELVFAMAWLVLVLSIGAIFLLMIMIREGEIARVGALFYLVPVVTALMAYVLFGEQLSPVQILGMAVTSAGVAIATQPATRARASR